MSTGGARVASTDSAVVHDFLSAEESAAQAAPSPWPSQRVFDCKTCNRRFSSFQALGGHRASHKEPELDLALSLSTADPSRRSKTHTCAICGEDFPIGQALGGHMRQHRRAPVVRRTPAAPSNPSSPAPKKSSGDDRVARLDSNPASSRVNSFP